MPSDLAHLIARFCSRRLMASATPSALDLPAWPANDSSIELDWSIRNRKQVGLVRLISALYGMRRLHTGRKGPGTGTGPDRSILPDGGRAASRKPAPSFPRRPWTRGGVISRQSPRIYLRK